MKITKLGKSLILFIGLLLLVGSVSALSLDFQNAIDVSSTQQLWGFGGGNSVTWQQSNSGQNSFMTTTTPGFSDTGFGNAQPIQMTYAAASIVATSSNANIRLYDSALNQLYGFQGDGSANHRYELKMIGGQAYIYRDGVVEGNSTVLSVNPSYVGFGTGYIGTSGYQSSWDDIVYGTTDSPYVFGMPEQKKWVITKDFTNPSASGFASYNNGVLGGIVNSNNMTTTWSKNNGINESIFLANTATGVIYATAYTGTAYTGSVSWPLANLFNTGAPFGQYRTYSSNGAGFSDSIFYIGAGSTVTFNSHTYSQGNTAQISWSVSSGPYWDTGLYDYRYRIIDIFGTQVTSVPVVTQTGSGTYTWTTANDPNVYYVVLEAVRKSDGVVVSQVYDYTTLNAYTTFAANVWDGSNTTALSGANVNISQSSVIYNGTSGFDGNYSTTGTGFFSGISTLINVTKSGYLPYQATIIPMKSGTISLDLVMRPISENVTGLAILGVDRTGILGIGINVTGGYGQPVSAASMVAQNTTYSEYYTTTTNSVGGYKFDQTTSAMLTHNRLYNIWGSKTGFGNSSVYSVVAP